MEAFSKRLLEARKSKGFTQSELAEKLDVSFQTVSLWERGETSPELDKIANIASCLGVDVGWLISGNDASEINPYEGDLEDRLFDENRMYTYIKTYATAKGLFQTVKVLPFVRKTHEGQVRKGKDEVPYIYHPLSITCHALALGLIDDVILSAALLHDTVEDCGVNIEDLPVDEETKAIVTLLTKDKSKGDFSEEVYYAEISQNSKAALVKLLDRCNNIAGMATGFSREKMISYIDETERYIYPLMSYTRSMNPEYSNAVFLIKYQITSVIETIKRLI